ncbi:MAG: hypothetical protein Q8R55_04880 [Candidatus Taylorbacteria bacterium]|nr:hypothetical protein [Candidatus Taylorbacteria bacterium]
MSRRYIIFLLLVSVLFIWLRFSGVHQIYHQDEHRWVMLADGSDPGPAPHPPMVLSSLKLVGSVFGFSNLRILSIFFSLLNLGLVYLIVKKVSKSFGAAMAAASLFTVNIYSLVASLQVDIDGTILPFFALLGYYGYISLLDGEHRKISVVLLAFSVVGGLLSKLSFVLFLGVLIVDYLIFLYAKNDKNIFSIIKKGAKTVVPILAAMGLFYYFYASNSHGIIDYGMHFKVLNFGSRAYLDLIFKVIKSFVWLSPLLSLPAIGGLFIREIRTRQRFWYLYLFINLIFYTVLFDFTTLTIERYFMFLIAPAVIISSDVLYYFYKKIAHPRLYNEFMAGIGFFSIFAALILLGRHIILPLNPKIAYLEHLKKFDLSFLIPFSSGSGPIGFYFSAGFIFWSWLIAVLLLVGLIWGGNKWRALLFSSFMVFGIGYNLLFVNELLNGSLYGSPDKIVHQTLDHVLAEPSIKRVITYNDIAPYELKKSGKYEARFYTAPSRDYTVRMSDYNGHYMVVNFPEIGESNKYWKLLERCPVVKEFQDKEIKSYIFDCTKLKP